MSGTFCEYGQQSGIGASCSVIRDENGNIVAVIDSGISFEKTGEFNFQLSPAGDYLRGEHVPLIILTHEHADHSGSMPRLVHEHPEAVVVMSRKVNDALWVMLKDSLKIQTSDIEDAARKGVTIEPIFNESDLVNFLTGANNDLLVIEEPGWYTDIVAGWNIGFYWAGHNPGAISVYMVPPSSRNPIQLTGDVSTQNLDIVDGVLTAPESFLNGFYELPGLTLITEATNGNRSIIRRPGHSLQEDLAHHIKQIDRDFFGLIDLTFARGGIVFCPAFANNRIPRLAKKLVQAGYPVWVDGLGRKMTLIQLPETEQWLKEGKLNFFSGDYTQGKQEREAADRGELGPCVILSPSATLLKGFAVEHAERILPGEKNTLISTGFRFDGSVTKQLFELESVERGRTIWLDKFKVGPVSVNVRCKDIRHCDYSGHDYLDSLAERVRLAKPKNLIVHHCNDDGFQGLESRVLALPNPPPKIVRGAHMQEIQLA
ncbi:MAG TPA: MBL fold metallo-hydrolase [Candidatus Paceibacterota bacterium]